MKIYIQRRGNLPNLSLREIDGETRHAELAKKLGLGPGETAELETGFSRSEVSRLMVEAFLRGVRLPNNHTQARSAAIKEVQRLLA